MIFNSLISFLHSNFNSLILEFPRILVNLISLRFQRSPAEIRYPLYRKYESRPRHQDFDLHSLDRGTGKREVGLRTKN